MPLIVRRRSLLERDPLFDIVPLDIVPPQLDVRQLLFYHLAQH